MSIVLKPEQLPQGVHTVQGRKSIQYHNSDHQVNLYCRQADNGDMKVVLADTYDWDEEREEWGDSECVEPKEAIKIFGHTKVYNPLQDRVVDLVC